MTTTVLTEWEGRNFVVIVRETVRENRNKPFSHWYDVDGKLTNSYTFGELWDEAGLIAHYIVNKWGVKKGDCVVLCYDFGLHFVAAFFGCLRVGVTAVLVYPP